MKKIIVILFIFIAASSLYSQSYFYNTTLSTTATRITALESSNYTNTLFGTMQYLTISGYADGDIIFSIGDSLFATKTSISFASGKAILLYNIHLTDLTTPMIWMKSASGTINADIHTRVF